MSSLSKVYGKDAKKWAKKFSRDAVPSTTKLPFESDAKITYKVEKLYQDTNYNMIVSINEHTKTNSGESNQPLGVFKKIQFD